MFTNSKQAKFVTYIQTSKTRDNVSNLDSMDHFSTINIYESPRHGLGGNERNLCFPRRGFMANLYTQI